MNHNNCEEDLERLNRLLERLHQAGYDRHCSHIEIVLVSPGAQHVDNQFVLGTHPQPETQSQPDQKSELQIRNSQPPNSCVPSVASDQRSSGKFDGTEVDSSEGKKNLPEVLGTEEAMALWRKAQQAGYVDEHYQPLISRTQAALLADAMAERLGIKEKWKVFGDLWERNNMRGDYTRAMNQRQSLDFQDKLKRLFSTDNEENTGKT